MSAIKQIKKSIETINIFLAKLESLSKDPNLHEDKKASEVAGDARVIIIQADYLKEAAFKIASAASAKEQHDYYVDNSAQAEENFLAVLQGRTPNKISGKKKVK